MNPHSAIAKHLGAMRHDLATTRLSPPTAAHKHMQGLYQDLSHLFPQLPPVERAVALYGLVKPQSRHILLGYAATALAGWVLTETIVPLKNQKKIQGLSVGKAFARWLMELSFR